jgi:molybdenum transport protein
MATVASRAELVRLLEDDVSHGDLTADLLEISEAAGVMAFTARAPHGASEHQIALRSITTKRK